MAHCLGATQFPRELQNLSKKKEIIKTRNSLPKEGQQ